ncbi:hypothetical protein BMF94_4263 [Rhodotorula taiwanensis]|uniref:Uncharacterized protein n=1 Tax=Rhodotorula taiwanensis TaxID=741276 RepID=A0A2S5B6P5_9BASI|nr:hypothetical protein BMF94_4263 [Rhodotorula taiwanensis]
MTACRTSWRSLLATCLVAVLFDAWSRTTGHGQGLGLFVAAQAGWEGVGTWSTGNGNVLTGPSLGAPYNNSFIYPNVTGYSFSFTSDGYFEQTQFTWNPNATDPHFEAIVLWQHGTYEVLTNGSITTNPTVFNGDGRIQTQNACSAVSSNIYYYNEPGLYQTWAVAPWRGKTMLRLGKYDGSLLPRMYLVSSDPSQFMFPTKFITNSSIGTYQIGSS